MVFCSLLYFGMERGGGEFYLFGFYIFMQQNYQKKGVIFFPVFFSFVMPPKRKKPMNFISRDASSRPLHFGTFQV